jgi:hypothetical protein
MRRFACCCSCTAILAGCATPDHVAVDTATAATAGDAVKNPLTLGAVTGRWRMVARNVRGDSLTSYELNANADTAGWTITFPNRPALPVRVVEVKGDSIVTDVGPYPSVLRQTIAVRQLRSVNRLNGDRLVGTFRATYETTAPDSVLYGIHDGKRIK